MWMIKTFRNSASSTGRCVLSAWTNMVPMIKRMMWEKMLSPTVNQKYSGKCKRGAEIWKIRNIWHRVVFKYTSVTSYPVKMVFKHLFRRIYLGIGCNSSMRAATCLYTSAINHPSHAGYRSILALASLAYTRTGQSERPVPIRTPERLSRLSGTKVNSIRTYE